MTPGWSLRPGALPWPVWVVYITASIILRGWETACLWIEICILLQLRMNNLCLDMALHQKFHGVMGFLDQPKIDKCSIETSVLSLKTLMSENVPGG